MVGITDLFVSGFPPDQVERYDMPPGRTRWEMAYDMLPEMQGRGIVGASVQAALGWCRWVGIPRLHAVSLGLGLHSSDDVRSRISE